ncbi:MAG: VCBS repeat-containing protein, partial [Gammaproteobacteria bacterium]|nr:VCBS repeat-containing protein [Gammaproteobacteria bacterium]
GNFGATNKYYLNDGDDDEDDDPFTGLTTGTNIGSDTDTTYSITLGDIDGDGDLDVIAGNDGATNKYYLNDGSGGFSAATGPNIGTDADATQSITLGDIDGDGDLDVIAGNNGINKLYLNDGDDDEDGDPFTAVLTGTNIGSDTDTTYSITLGDIDGDGVLDVIAGNYGANELNLNTAGGRLTAGTVIGTDIGSNTYDTRSIALGDIDNDGDLDVVVGNASDTNKLYLNDGSGGFDTGTGTDIGINDVNDTRSIALGDVDGDGYLDVIAGNFNQYRGGEI